MPTLADAPYKVAQREAELALRTSRRALVIDRAKLLASTRIAAAAVREARGTPAWPAADQRLRRLWSMLTRSERLALATHAQ